MKHSLRYASAVLAATAIFLIGYVLGGSGYVAPAQAQTGQPTETERLFAPFWEAWDIIHERFVDIDTVDDNALMEGALNGMIAVLGDENTMYAGPEAFARQNEDMQGEYQGIGATVRTDEATGGVLIVSTMAGSPARELLRQGDVIVRVDGEDVTRMSLQEAIGMIRGPAGTSVMLSVLRGDVDGPIDVPITRARITREFVSSALFEGEIGYIAITQFAAPVAGELTQALNQLDANNLKGLILDMRGDPGGYLDTALAVASQFLPKGTLIIQRSRPGSEEIQHQAAGNALAPDVPLVVLLNAGSASASELVAGALQARGRATIIGEVSFGKGSVQQISGLSNGGGLRVTVSRFYAPDGTTIDKIGVIPDIYVSWTEDQARANPDYDPQLAEAIWFLQGKF
ncbi:MAG: S41 family peptidase [Anaerolineae bacterium]|nr:S41 family peptidase [Anaerolineae bacterium]